MLGALSFANIQICLSSTCWAEVAKVKMLPHYQKVAITYTIQYLPCHLLNKNHQWTIRSQLYPVGFFMDHPEESDLVHQHSVAVRDFIGASLVAQMAKNLPATQETWVQYLGQDNPWRREWLPTLVFLPGEFHGKRSMAGYSPQGCKESDTSE